MKIVLAGVIFCREKVLIAQRKHGKAEEYLWEFPGGKLEENETLEEGLLRELKEELHLSVKIHKFFMESRFAYPNGEILLKAYLCSCLRTDITWLDSHEQIKWVKISEMSNYLFAPADRPIVRALEKQPEIINELTAEE